MKKVIYTCISGDYDDVPIHNYLDETWEYILFTDNKELLKQKKIYHWKIKPLAYKKLDNVKNSRWPKLNPHIILKKYDFSLWIDANISIQKKSVFNKIDCFIENDVLLAVPLHPERNCIYKEAEVIKEFGIDYATVVDAEMDILKKERYPENNGLYACGLIFRQHKKIKKALDLWWIMVMRFSKRDQLSFCYAMWKHGVKITSFYGDVDSFFCNDDFKFVYKPSHDQNKINNQWQMKKKTNFSLLKSKVKYFLNLLRR